MTTIFPPALGIIIIIIIIIVAFFACAGNLPLAFRVPCGEELFFHKHLVREHRFIGNY